MNKGIQRILYSIRCIYLIMYIHTVFIRKLSRIRYYIYLNIYVQYCIKGPLGILLPIFPEIMSGNFC